MNLTLMLDEYFHEKAKLLSSYYGIHDNTYLGQFAKPCNLPEATLSTLANWVNRGIDFE